MDYRIETVLRLMERDMGRSCRPAQLAGEICLSVSRFYDLFRQETGTVPARYLRMCRFERARQLILTTNLSIKEVATRVGVHDISHFVRDFQKTYGTSPKTFRRAARQSGSAASQEEPPIRSNSGQLLCLCRLEGQAYTGPNRPANS